MTPSAAALPSITPEQLRALLQQVADFLCQRFAPEVRAHEEAVFAAAALIMPELEIRRATVRLKVCNRAASDDRGCLAGSPEASRPAIFTNGEQFNLAGPVSDDQDRFTGAREASRFAIFMDGAQFNLAGPVSDTQLSDLAQEGLIEKIRQSHPHAECRLVHPPSRIWVNPQHLELSPRLSTRLPVARAQLRTLLQAHALEKDTTPSTATRPHARL